MDTERLAIDAEVIWVRTRGWLRVCLRLFGLGLVILAIYNLVGPAFSRYGAVAPYRAPVVSVLSLDTGAAYIADVLVLGVGLVVSWWG